MKKFFTIMLLAVSISAASQNSVYWIGDQYSQWQWGLRGSPDEGMTFVEMMIVDTFKIDIKADTLQLSAIDTVSGDKRLLVVDNSGNVGYIEMQEFSRTDNVITLSNGGTLTFGEGFTVTGTGNNITISFDEPELLQGAPMKNGLMPLVLKTEIYDVNGNLVPEIIKSGECVVWNYLSNGEIEKTHIVSK